MRLASREPRQPNSHTSIDEFEGALVLNLPEPQAHR
jgi:hypothetical protein